MEYLQKEDIIIINKKTIERHGGNFTPPFNFLHEFYGKDNQPKYLSIYPSKYRMSLL